MTEIKQQRKLVVSLLQKTIDKLKELRPEQFKYDLYITKGDSENLCGTVCCVAGYYPKWFPDSGLIYGLEPGGNVELQKPFKYRDINYVLQKYHYLNQAVINALFYGGRLGEWLDNVSDMGTMEDVSLSKVIQRFETVVKLITEGKIDYLILT